MARKYAKQMRRDKERKEKQVMEAYNVKEDHTYTNGKDRFYVNKIYPHWYVTDDGEITHKLIVNLSNSIIGVQPMELEVFAKWAVEDLGEVEK
jgi:hypothetical protein